MTDGVLLGVGVALLVGDGVDVALLVGDGALQWPKYVWHPTSQYAEVVPQNPRWEQQKLSWHE